jgi:hypothetical protein
MQKILDKLAKDKRSVNLNTADEIRSEMERISDDLGLASYYAYERFEEISDKVAEFKSEISIEVDNQIVNSEVTYPEDKLQGLKEMLMPVEHVAESLGVNPNELMPEFDEALELMKQYEEVYNDYRDAYNTLVRESGFLAQF